MGIIPNPFGTKTDLPSINQQSSCPKDTRRYHPLQKWWSEAKITLFKCELRKRSFVFSLQPSLPYGPICHDSVTTKTTSTLLFEK
ncbi:hypothetical protein L873DRAFT_973494 [Choiromyces venosus 120613-1]|uniref:Uncharacterized protein n=1 Tax=Choiromyces venosus 120613-1 TaxID=1336337 RepID=A0A3N4JPD8_9PEZI|nr:hypothetical protein L873DRAFT_973494 [Choiromyces venosus 120613-1]